MKKTNILSINFDFIGVDATWICGQLRASRNNNKNGYVSCFMFHVLKAGGGIVAGVAAAELIGSSVKEVIRGAKEANAHEPLRRPGIHVRDQ